MVISCLKQRKHTRVCFYKYPVLSLSTSFSRCAVRPPPPPPYVLLRMPTITKVVTAVCNDAPRPAALSELVVRLVNDSLIEYSYAACVAGLEYSLKAMDAGFQVRRNANAEVPTGN